MTIHLPSKSVSICVGVCLLCFASKIVLERTIPKRQSPVSLKPIQAGFHGNSLSRCSLGFKSLIADLIWVDLLQRASHKPIASEEVSWEYAQLDAITSLDPNFDRSYSFGAAFLSVFREDKLGAKLFLQKWVRRRPNHWYAHYVLGYHLFREMKEYKLAASHIFKAGSLEGAPSWLPALGIRLLSETGSLMQALDLSISLYADMRDTEGRYRLIQRIRNINFAIQKAGWEKALQAFLKTKKRRPVGVEELAAYLPNFERGVASLIANRERDDFLVSSLKEVFAFKYDLKANRVVSAVDPKDLGIDRVGIYRGKEEKK